MTTNAPYHEMIRDVVEDTMRLINQYVDVFLDDIWPSLVEIQKPGQRLEFYRTLDWGALRTTSEQLWQRMSTDALQLEAAEERRIAGAIESYGKSIQRQMTAFGGEQKPYGSAPAVEMGAPLPLGRITA